MISPSIHTPCQRREVFLSREDFPATDADSTSESEALFEQLAGAQDNGPVTRQALTGLLRGLHQGCRTDVYITPERSDGSQLTVDVSKALEVTISAVMAGQTTRSFTATLAHPAWACLSASPEYARLITEWQEWANAPLTSQEKRAESMEKMVECLLSGGKELKIDSMELTSLPAHLPPDLAILDVRENQMTALPILPAGLTILVAYNNRLTALPTLPAGLTTLNVSNNWITFLPALPVGLTTLVADYNRLTTLPTLFTRLTELSVRNNQLTVLPDLPSGLTTLVVSNNRLSTLPTLPAEIIILDVRENLFNSTDIQQQSLQTEEDTADIITREVARWYPQNETAQVQVAWSQLVGKDGVSDFCQFLFRLSESPASLQPGFCQQVAGWLTVLSTNEALRDVSLAVAREASESCVDRAALGWNKMQTARILHESEQASPEVFILSARQIFRLEEVEKIAAAKYLSLTSGADEVEVHLAYMAGLKEVLSLPDSFATEMSFRTLSRVSEANILEAGEKVLAAECKSFIAWLPQWEPCRKYLQRNMTDEEKNKLEESLMNAFRRYMDALQDAHGDFASVYADVERGLGVRAMQLAYEEIYHPMAEETFMLK